MKTKIIIVSLATMLSASVFAQNSANNMDVAISSVPSKPVYATEGGTSVALSSVSEKIQKSFNHLFPDAKYQKWEMTGKNISTSFYSNNLFTTAKFNKDGRLAYTVIFCNERNLPADLREMVKSEYPDYSFVRISEVKLNQRDIWLSYLENNDSNIIVRIENNQMELVSKTKK